MCFVAGGTLHVGVTGVTALKWARMWSALKLFIKLSSAVCFFVVEDLCLPKSVLLLGSYKMVSFLIMLFLPHLLLVLIY